MASQKSWNCPVVGRLKKHLCCKHRQNWNLKIFEILNMDILSQLNGPQCCCVFVGSTILDLKLFWLLEGCVCAAGTLVVQNRDEVAGAAR